MSPAGKAEHGQRRPIIVYIFCVFAVLTSMYFAYVLLLHREQGAQYGTGAVVRVVLASFGTMLSAIGCWQMRRWGVYLYTGILGMNVVGNIIVSRGISLDVLPGGIPLGILVTLWLRLSKFR